MRSQRNLKKTKPKDNNLQRNEPGSLIIPPLTEKTKQKLLLFSDVLIRCGTVGADFIQSCRYNKPFCITLSLVTRYFKSLLTVHKIQVFYQRHASVLRPARALTRSSFLWGWTPSGGKPHRCPRSSDKTEVKMLQCTVFKM